MRKKVQLLQVSVKERVSKTGKPYKSLGIKIEGKNGPMWLSGFGNKTTMAWKSGDVVEIDAEKRGDYWNFSPVEITLNDVYEKLCSLERRIAEATINAVFPGADVVSELPEPDLPTEEEPPMPKEPEDISF